MPAAPQTPVLLLPPLLPLLLFLLFITHTNAQCTTPSTSAYNGANKIETDLTLASFSVSNWACASGFTGSASATVCSTDATPYTVSGCAPESCTTPSTTGYNGASKNEVSKIRNSFSVNGWACASGFTGSASATVCNTHATPYTVSGCAPESCTTPSTTGYNGASKNEVSKIRNSFSVNGWVCRTDLGYSGSASASVCSNHGYSYQLAGCSLTNCLPRSSGAEYSWVVHGSDNHKRTQFYLGDVRCAAGYKGTAYSACNSAGQQWSYSGCSKCVSGKYKQARGNHNCAACPKGYYQNQQGISNCKQCPLGQYTDQDQQSGCKHCLKGWNQNVVGSSSCKTCVVGKYTNENQQSTCKNCPQGYYQPSVQKQACSACGTGKVQPSTAKGSCNSCVGGKYQNQNQQSTCKNCPKGSYESSLASTNPSCKTCLSGRNAVNVGSASCATCSLGRASTSKTTACATCTSGKYQENNVATYYNCKSCSYGVKVTSIGCDNCAKGKHQNELAKTSCKVCGKGRYADVVGLTNCKICGVGQYQTQTQQYACVLCSIGQYTNQNENKVGCTNW